MARPERTNVDYFPFLCKEGKAMYFIDKKYGNDGYATWVKILRELAVTNNHHLVLSNNSDMMYMASRCNITTEVLENILTDLSNLGEINADLWLNAKVVWSEKFIEHIQDAYKKRNNKCITFEGLRVLLIGLGILLPNKLQSKVSDNTQSKVEYSKVDKSKEGEGDKSPPQNIDQRIEEFRISLIPFVEEFSKEIVRDFFDYWSEKDKSGKKMRWEYQKTFEPQKRLSTWARKNLEFSKKNNLNNGSYQKQNTGANPSARPVSTGKSFFGD